MDDRSESIIRDMLEIPKRRRMERMAGTTQIVLMFCLLCVSIVSVLLLVAEREERAIEREERIIERQERAELRDSVIESSQMIADLLSEWAKEKQDDGEGR